jgi:uroporphyrinogen decarboxylase
MPGESMTAAKPARSFKQTANFDYLRNVIMREVTNGPVPIIEMMVDGSIMGQVTGLDHPLDKMTELMELFTSGQYSPEQALEKAFEFINLTMAFSKHMGYDSTIGFASVPMPRSRSVFSGEVEGSTARPWQDEHSGMIPDREAFEAFPWPDVDDISIDSLDYIAGNLAPGMKIHLMYMGIFEDLRALMGFETLAFASVDDPELVADIINKLAVLAETAIDKAAAHPDVGMIMYADDMGFRTSTMLSPDFFREYVMPGQKACVDATHRHGKPFILHSCGQIDELMEDLIEYVGIDGLHSFEDIIEPVESVYQRYGDRISILGGVDVSLLAAASPQEVRDRVRQILNVCGKKGGFALGSGNSVPNYAKIENYYAMIDETRIWNEEQGLSFNN